MASFSLARAETIVMMVGKPALNQGWPKGPSLSWKHRTDTSFFSLRASSSSAKAIVVGSEEKASPPPFNSALMSAMECKIKEQLQAEQVIVRDAYGDGHHVSIEVVSEAFEGQSEVNRQRLVYKAIWEELQSVVHAVDHMETKTPAEASERMS